MSAVFFQDMFGLVTFDAGARHLSAVRPRIGRNHVIHCLDAYQDRRRLQDVRQTGSLSMTIASFMRKTALVPFVSDFLFDDPETVIGELALLNTTHDVFVVLVDAAFAFEVPRVSAGWIETVDVETGRTRVMSRRALSAMAGRIRQWQDGVTHRAREAGLDVVRIGAEAGTSELALSEFVAERRLKKVA
jgi:small ligand-binding sensory domain FIST